MDLKLVEPHLGLREAFFRYCQAFCAAGEPPRPLQDLAFQNFPAYLQRIQEASQGIGIPKDYVPATTYWLVSGEQAILGNSSLRHRLNPRLEDIGGHIGYSIHPFERCKGYGSLLLKLTLQKAREMGLARVLITCDADNLGSVGVIIKNGGQLASQAFAAPTGKLISRYWIDL